MVQINSPRLFLRVKFRKGGSLQYISHLDLVRTMHKIIVRAGLPLWYTEGFNPKPKMIFAAPLSIGTESVCEFMDVRLIEPISPAVAMERLNANMTEEMQVIEAYYPETKFTDLKWLSYTMRIVTSGVSEELAACCNKALSKEQISVEKKNSDTTVDIRSLIKSAEVVADGDELRLSCLLSADQSKFLNPEYVIKYLQREVGILSSGNLTEEYYSIMRERAYTADMTEFR